jgi:hypothetical protein
MAPAGAVITETGVLMVAEVQLLEGAVQLVKMVPILWGFLRADWGMRMIIGNILGA